MKQISSKIIKYILITFFSLFLIFSTGIAYLIYLYPKEKLLKVITTHIEDKIDNKIVIGDLNYNLTGIKLSKITIFDGKSTDSPTLLSSEHISIRFSIFSLLKDEIEINKIYLNNTTANIIFDNNGYSNIEKLISNSKDSNSSNDLKKKEKSTTTGSIKISKIRIDKLFLNIENPPDPIDGLNGKFEINTDIEFLKNSMIHFYNSKITLPENRGILKPDLKLNITNNDFKITGKSEVEKFKLLWIYKWQDVRQAVSEVNGKVENLSITKSKISGHAIAQGKLFKSKSRVNAVGECEIDIDKERVNISEVKVSTSSSSLNVKTLIIDFDGNFKNFSFNNLNTNFSDIRLYTDEIPFKLNGFITGHISYANNLYNGKLNLKKIKYGIKEKVISDLSTTFNIQNNQFKNLLIPVKILGNNCKISIASMGENFKNFYINLLADKFIIPKNSSNKEHKENKKKSNSYTKIPVNIVGNINIKKFNYDDINIFNINTNFKILNNHVKLYKTSAKFMDGNIFGNADINLKTIKMKTSAQLNFRNIKIQNISLLNENFKNRIFGILKGKAKLNFSIANLFNALNGNINFTIERGKIVNTGIQKGLGLLLSELKYKLTDLEFNKIYGNFSINKDYYNINTFIFNSEKIKMKINGILSRKLIAKNMLVSLEFTKHFIQDLPTAAVAIKLRKNLKGNWYIIPFIINGDISDSKNIKEL